MGEVSPSLQPPSGVFRYPLALTKYTPLCITIVWNIRLRGRSTLFLDPNHIDIS